MVISSFYSVFTTTRIELYMKMLEGRDGLKIVHHFENEMFDYYVMKDQSGNSTDLIQFKNRKDDHLLFLNTKYYPYLEKRYHSFHTYHIFLVMSQV